MNYTKLKETQTNEMNEFSENKIYFIFASSEKQFLKKLTEKNLTIDEITGIGGGGYIKTEYLPDFKKLLKKQSKELHEYIINNIYEVVNYESWNYEMEISMSYTYHTLLTDILCLSEEEISNNKNEIDRAIKDYRKEFWELN